MTSRRAARTGSFVCRRRACPSLVWLSILVCAACAPTSETGGAGAAGTAAGGSAIGASGNAGESVGGSAGASGSGTAGVRPTGTGGTSAGAGAVGGSGGSTAGAGTDGGGGAQAGGGGAAGTGGSGGSDLTPVSLTIFDEVVFYDGYASVVDEPVPAGVQRLRNDLFTHKLSAEELDAIQNTLRIQVVIGALCDNYDRIGGVALALVPKGEDSYTADAVDRLEVGRFVTPFMDWNKQPDEVPFDYDASNLVPVLHDADLRAQYDLWLELELFGVPYAANTEVSGCADRNDVFRGTLILDSDRSVAAVEFDEVIPIAYRQPFNNYQEGASDSVGTTRKTIEFTLAAATAETQLVLITSNHGANAGGEEYNRRDHFVYIDDDLELMYKPGRPTCEPFRMFNTQANGIYGAQPRSDSSWQAQSNWCPGDVIDTRVIQLGPMSAGSHEFVIEVPDAQFAGGEGDIPFSLYVQSRSN